MTATAAHVQTSAPHLLAAARDRREQAPLTDEWPDLDLDTAYRIQDEALRLRVARGERVVGVKLGLTSAKKQRQMNVDSPLTAWLTDAMVLEQGVRLPQSQLIHPRVEPEIVFVMGSTLRGPGVTVEQALAAVDRVQCGLEVIDSRYRDFRFTLPDVVADNASSALFVTSGRAVDASTMDLVVERCTLHVDGEEVSTGSGADVQGHPAVALALAANTLAARGHAIEAGWIVLTGGITDAVTARPGASIEARFSTLGTIALDC